MAAGEAVSFKVVMRRGGREDRSRELHIPLTAGMAAHLRQKEAAEAVEKAELKRLVLAANSRGQQVGGAERAAGLLVVWAMQKFGARLVQLCC